MMMQQVDARALACGALAFCTAYKILKHAFQSYPEGVYLAPKDKGVLGYLGSHFFGIRAGECGATYLSWCRAASGKPVGFSFFNTDPRLILTDPKDIEYILLQNPANYAKSPSYKMFVPLLGNGLVTIMDESAHTVQRRAVSAAFSPAALRTVANTTVRTHAVGMMDFIAKKAAADGGSTNLPVADLLSKTALAIIAEAAFRSDTAGIAEVFTNAGSAFTKVRAIMLLPMNEYLPIAANRLVWRARSMLTAATTSILKEVRAGGKPADGQGKALIDYLAWSKDLSPTDVLDHSVTFMFAGHDTSSSALTWLCYALARNPSVQDTLYEELCSAMSATACPDVNALQSLPYLQCVIKETLRMWSPAVNVGRTNVHDDLLPGSNVHLPAGSFLYVCVFAIHRLESIWGPDADTFRPERWEDPTLQEKIGTVGFMPFALGKRNCIGKDLALLEMTIIAALLFRRFEVRWNDSEPAPYRSWGLILKPEVDHPLRVTPRRS